VGDGGVLSIWYWHRNWESGEVIDCCEDVFVPMLIDREGANYVKTDSVKWGSRGERSC
jgi:hypothetical protein